MKERRGAWTPGSEVGPFDLIGEYLQEHVEGRTVNGVPPAFSDFTTDGFYVPGAITSFRRNCRLWFNGST